MNSDTGGTRSPHTGTGEAAEVEAEIARVVQSVNEWDDRTSPDGYPDHLLITPEELTLILRNFAVSLREPSIQGNDQ